VVERNLAWLSVVVLTVSLGASPMTAWNNGPSGNARTDQASECSSPPCSTPAQIAEAQKLAREWQAAFDARQK